MCVFEPCAFWGDLLANLLPELLVGLGLALFVDIQISRLRRVQERKQARREETTKALQYVAFIRAEINHFVDKILKWTELVEDRRPPLDLLGTTYWDILQPSGELPKLLSPDLLRHLVSFYSELAIARRIVEGVVDDTKNERRLTDDGQATMRVSIRELSKFAPQLEDSLDAEDERLEAELQALKSTGKR